MANDTAFSSYPLVSIIVPVYNRAHLLRRTIGCLTNQSYKNLEIILIDDCSVDDVEAAVQDLNDSRITLIKMELNRGASAARNIGIANSSGDLIAFHDSDDICVFDKVERQVKTLLELSDEYIGVYTAVLFYTGVSEGQYSTMKSYILPSPTTRQLSGNMYRQTVSGNMMNLPTMLIRRSILEETGGFDERLRNNNDWDLALRIAQLGKFKFIPEPMYLVANPSSPSEQGEHISRSLRSSVISFGIITGKLRRRGERSRALALSYSTLAGFLLRLNKTKSARRYARASLAISPLWNRSFIFLCLSYSPMCYRALRSIKRCGKPKIKA